MKIKFDEKGKYFTDVVRKDPLPAVIQTERHRISGNIYVRDGMRVKDALEESGPFVAVTNASVFDMDNNLQHECEFLALNRDHIVWVFLDVSEQDEEAVDG